MTLASKEQYQAVRAPALPERLESPIEIRPAVREIETRMSKHSSTELPETATKIYVYSNSSLVGERVSVIKERFHLEIENLGPSPSDGMLVEGSEFRISGSAKSMDAFLQRYF